MSAEDDNFSPASCAKRALPAPDSGSPKRTTLAGIRGDPSDHPQPQGPVGRPTEAVGTRSARPAPAARAWIGVGVGGRVLDGLGASAPERGNL